MTEYPYVRAAFINAIAEEGTKEEAVSYLQKYWNENCALRAEIERLTASNAALIRERSSMIQTHRDNINRLRADLDGWKQAARQVEAERDEALAQVEAAYACGWQHGNHPDANTMPADAQATLEACGREKMREGMQRAAEIIRGGCPECLGTGVRDSGGVHPWGEPISVPCDCTDAILAAMEALK